MNFYLYFLRQSNNRLYVGISSDPDKRLGYHLVSKGAKYTKHSSFSKLVYTEEFPDLAAAMSREKQIKGWTRAKKEALINNDLDLLKKL